MSNNSESNNKNVNKITILNISGKKKDREILKKSLYKNNFVINYTYRDFTRCSTRQILRKILNCQFFSDLFLSPIMIFENLNSNIVKNIGDELDNMILDIHLNKYNKKIASQQIQEVLELLEKL